MNFGLPLTISMERRDGTPRRVSYELPFARGVHVFVTGHEPSHVVHAVQSFAWETELSESYDKEGSYTFTISQGGEEVSTSWDKGVYKGIKTPGISPMLRSIIEPSDVPEQWARDVEKAAYPDGASIPASLRQVLEQVLSWRVVALTYPEHGLYPRAVRALANGLKELNQVIMEGDLPMLVLVETASAGFLDDLTSPNEQGSLGDRVVFTTYDGLLPLQEMSEAYLSHFRLGDLYYAEDPFVSGKRPDAAPEM